MSFYSICFHLFILYYYFVFYPFIFTLPFELHIHFQPTLTSLFGIKVVIEQQNLLPYGCEANTLHCVTTYYNYFFDI